MREAARQRRVRRSPSPAAAVADRFGPARDRPPVPATVSVAVRGDERLEPCGPGHAHLRAELEQLAGLTLIGPRHVGPIAVPERLRSTAAHADAADQAAHRPGTAPAHRGAAARAAGVDHALGSGGVDGPGPVPDVHLGDGYGGPEPAQRPPAAAAR